LKISGQVPKEFWGRKIIKPDIITEYIIEKNAKKVIIDTKWKVLKDNIPTGEDLKQMFAYKKPMTLPEEPQRDSMNLRMEIVYSIL